MKHEELLAALKGIKALAEDCIAALGNESAAKPSFKPKRRPAQTSASPDVDFGKPLRPFIKSYGKGLSGSKKFALLLSWLAKGDLKKEIALQDIQGHWNRTTSLLGKYNGFFAADAREHDWVDLKKKGLYVLRPSWKEIFTG